MDAATQLSPPSNASLEVQVAELRVQSNNTAVAVSAIQLGMASQDAKLDILVADLNKRAGAEAQSGKFGRVVLGLFAIGGPLGAVWAYFHGAK